MDPYQQMASHELTVMRRMKSPIVSTIFNSQDVSFERYSIESIDYYLLLCFISDRSQVYGALDQIEVKLSMDLMPKYKQCLLYYFYCPQVFSVTGLDIVTRTRVDHLPDEEKQKQKCKLHFLLFLTLQISLQLLVLVLCKAFLACQKKKLPKQIYRVLDCSQVVLLFLKLMKEPMGLSYQ